MRKRATEQSENCIENLMALQILELKLLGVSNWKDRNWILTEMRPDINTTK